MNNVLPRITTKLGRNRLVSNSFVGRFIPFVIYMNSIFIPFICINLPNSTFQPAKRRIQGFTLIELLVAIAVVAVLAGVAVPNMRTSIQNGRLSTQVNDLIGDLNFARSEAIKRRSNVGICRSTDGVTFAGAGPLGDGRVVFVDAPPANGVCDAGDTILRFREPLAAGNTLAAAPPNPIMFSANGSPVAVGTFTVCDYRGLAKGKQINLNSVGQATVRTVATGACL
jgi:type IV fimbrial biogenesis protein FimT